MATYASKIFKFAYNSKTTSRAKIKFEHNIVATGGFVCTVFRSARSRDQNFRGRKSG